MSSFHLSHNLDPTATAATLQPVSHETRQDWTVHLSYPISSRTYSHTALVVQLALLLSRKLCCYRPNLALRHPLLFFSFYFKDSKKDPEYGLRLCMYEVLCRADLTALRNVTFSSTEICIGLHLAWYLQARACIFPKIAQKTKTR